MSLGISLYFLLYEGKQGCRLLLTDVYGNGTGNRAVCGGGGQVVRPMVSGVEGVVNENAKKTG
tara:strand:+ start:331 stop:519 length:189 start_codon:yes stop_codon:yes gene_type:complete